jgi:hypothetical protein
MAEVAKLGPADQDAELVDLRLHGRGVGFEVERHHEQS